MPQGTIKKVMTDKGFGFIQTDEGDVLFYYSALEGMPIEELRERDIVQLAIEQSDKGPRATYIRLATAREGATYSLLRLQGIFTINLDFDGEVEQILQHEIDFAVGIPERRRCTQ